MTENQRKVYDATTKGAVEIIEKYKTFPERNVALLQMILFELYLLRIMKEFK